MARWDFPAGGEQSGSETPTPGQRGPQHGGLAGRWGLVGATDHSQTSEAATVAQTHPNPR